mmetsp:Transcript_95376/g.302688  ORF Transcript_95376/g.302688 Transcript_95376/m.302688 type:complete len:226 (-) Transcript_95376:183-860(-)
MHTHACTSPKIWSTAGVSCPAATRWASSQSTAGGPVAAEENARTRVAEAWRARPRPARPHLRLVPDVGRPSAGRGRPRRSDLRLPPGGRAAGANTGHGRSGSGTVACTSKPLLCRIKSALLERGAQLPGEHAQPLTQVPGGAGPGAGDGAGAQEAAVQAALAHLGLQLLQADARAGKLCLLALDVCVEGCQMSLTGGRLRGRPWRQHPDLQAGLLHLVLDAFDLR